MSPLGPREADGADPSKDQLVTNDLLMSWYLSPTLGVVQAWG
jgi:hypothetical protein